MDERGTIIAGHGRVLAAQSLGIADVPVMVAAGWSEAQKRAYVIADNKLALNAGWDADLLPVELGDLKAMGFDLGLTGFGELELGKLLPNEAGDGDPDQAPEPPVEPITKPGDLWICGEHRVLCGDATVRADVDRLLDGELADMTFCDPPYGVNYANSAKDRLRGKSRPILNDNLGEGFGPFLQAASANMLAVTKGAVYICMSSSELDTLQRAFREAGGKWSTFLIWAKNTFTLGRADYQRQYEPDPVWMEGRHRSLLVWGAGSGRRLVLRQAGEERSASDHEAGGAGRARHQELVEEPGHRARSLRRLGHDDDCRGAHRPTGAHPGAGSAVHRCDRSALGRTGRAQGRNGREIAT